MSLFPPAAPAMGSLSPSATLSITAKAKKLKAEGKDVLALSSGEPDFDTPVHIKDAAIQALLEGMTKYTPASGEMALREAIAEKLTLENGVPTVGSNVVVGVGAKFSCFSAIAALCGPGDEVLIPAPYWVSYPEMVKAAGATPVILPTRADNNFEVDPDELSRAITGNTRLLILNSPSNPTGAVYRESTLKAIANVMTSKGLMVLADEIYEKLVYDEAFPHVSLASFGEDVANLTITVNGFSKAYSMTGWRLGYLTGPEWLVKRVAALQSHSTSNPTSFAQCGALAALKGPREPIEAMRQSFAKRRDLIYNLFGEIDGVERIRPQGAFYIFVDVSKLEADSMVFCDRLLSEKLVATIPGVAFGAEGHLRVSYACSEEHIISAVGRFKEFAASL